MVYMPAQSFFFLAFFKNGGPSKTLKSPAYPRICHDLGKAGDLSDCSDCSWNTEECFPLIVSPGMKKHAHVMFQHWTTCTWVPEAPPALLLELWDGVFACAWHLWLPGRGREERNNSRNLEKGWSNLPDLPRTEMAGRSWQCGMAACGVTSSCVLAGLCRRWRLALVRFCSWKAETLPSARFYVLLSGSGMPVRTRADTCPRRDTQLTGSRVPCQLRMATCFMRSGQGRPSGTTGPTRQFDSECEVVKLAVFLPLAYWGGDLLAATSTSSRGTW